jgi:hypothetical protein
MSQPSVDSAMNAPAHFMLGGLWLATWMNVGASESPPKKDRIVLKRGQRMWFAHSPPRLG